MLRRAAGLSGSGGGGAATSSSLSGAGASASNQRMGSAMTASLFLILQPSDVLLEGLSSGMEPRINSTEGHADLLSDLLAGVALQLEHHEHGALLQTQ